MTYREIIYACLDFAKQLSDDMIIDEEHVLVLIQKYRASLLMQKYKSIKLEVPESNYQTLCLDLTEVSPIAGNPCEGQNYLRSECLPKLIGIGNTVVYPQDFYQGVNICLIPRERMRFVGSNPIMRNIIYCSYNPDGKMYFKSENPQFLYLKKVRITGVFEDPLTASDLDCLSCDSSCEPLDRTFPLEETLITLLIASVVKDIVGASYRPADQQNNANDDLASLANFIRLNAKSNLQKQIEG